MPSAYEMEPDLYKGRLNTKLAAVSGGSFTMYDKSKALQKRRSLHRGLALVEGSIKLPAFRESSMLNPWRFGKGRLEEVASSYLSYVQSVPRLQKAWRTGMERNIVRESQELLDRIMTLLQDGLKTPLVIPFWIPEEDLHAWMAAFSEAVKEDGPYLAHDRAVKVLEGVVFRPASARPYIHREGGLDQTKVISWLLREADLTLTPLAPATRSLLPRILTSPGKFVAVNRVRRLLFEGEGLRAEVRRRGKHCGLPTATEVLLAVLEGLPHLGGPQPQTSLHDLASLYTEHPNLAPVEGVTGPSFEV